MLRAHPSCRLGLVAALALACGPAPASGPTASPVPASSPAPTPAPPPVPTTAPVREVAVTFDDLIVGGRDPGIARDKLMTEALLAHIRAGDVPAVGFVNEAKLCDCDEREARIAILKLWTDAGLELGNHTYSHPSLQDTPLADFEADVVKGEPVTRQLLAGTPFSLRWFRHPYLRTGPTAAVRREFEQFLADRGYKVAPVTLDNSDWMFNFLYTEARTRDDAELMRRTGAAFVAYVEEMVAFYERAEQSMFGRPIRHILLLHANELNADYFDDVVAMFRARGYRFVTLEHALADPAYQERDDYVGGAGVSWMYRWDFTRGRKQVDWTVETSPPAFVREYYESDGKDYPADAK